MAHRHGIMFGHLLIGASALCAVVGVAGAAGAQTAAPLVAPVPASSHPPVPAGMKVACMINGSSLNPSPTCPIIMYGGNNTWVYSFIDNREAYGVVTYDAQRNVVKNQTRNGARYVYKITVDPLAQTVSLWGQSDKKVIVKWADLPTQAPQIKTVPANSHPPIPAGMKVTCMINGGSLNPSPTCPVIQRGATTTWAYSFIDNRVAYGIVTYDAQGNVLKNVTRNGARYVYKMTLDPARQTIGVWGQGDAKVDVKWSDIP